MAKNTEVYFTKNARVEGTSFTIADLTNVKTVATAGIDGSRITFISCLSDDSVARSLDVYVYNTSNQYLAWQIKAIAPGSGTDESNPAVSGMNDSDTPFLNQDNDGNYYLELGANYEIRMAAHTSVTTGKTVTVTIGIEDY